jgi:hypothetical protein
MKKYLAALIVVALSGAASLYGIDAITATVPFDFTVGGKVLHAGDYLILPGTTEGTMLIRSLEGYGGALTLAIKSQRRQIPEVFTRWTPGPAATLNQPVPGSVPRAASGEFCVIFNKYGNEYFISKIWVGLEGREFPVSPTERRLKTASIGQQVVVLEAVLRQE